MSDDIGKVADEVIGRMKTTEELKHVPFGMYARVLYRAERAEAECKALREALEQLESILVRGDKSVSFMLMKAHAALNPSPADKAPT